MSRSATAFAPASVGNIGVGFDLLGHEQHLGRHRHGESAQELVHRCGIALRQAKRSGRNRVALAP